MSDEEDIILSELSDEDLVLQMHDDLYDGLKEEIEEGTQILLDRGWTAEQVLGKALVDGMTIVGIDFRDGILFVPEVLLAANAMKGGMAILRPLLAETGAKPVGTMVIGTVKGDIHDIGKNLVAMMLEGAGFEVYDIGINNAVEDYIAALERHKPDILGMSALLTTTMPYMKVVIDALKEQGIRDDYIVMVGGAPLNEEFGEAVGADAYCRDAAEAATTAVHLGRLLVIGCGALAEELSALKRANQWTALDIKCLDAALHNRPEQIADRLESVLAQYHAEYTNILIAYADCGTGGAVDRVARQFNAQRLPGAHCYEFYATSPVFEALAEAEPGTFYLTDFLVRHFDRLVIEEMKLDEYPELEEMLFGRYRKVVYLAQVDSSELLQQAERAARRLKLPLEVVTTGYGLLAKTVEEEVIRVIA